MTKEIIPMAVSREKYEEVQKWRRTVISDEDLELLKFELGWLKIEEMSVPPEVKYKLKRSAAFRAWLNQIWYLNDLKTMKYWEDWITEDIYRKSHPYLLSKYKVNRAAMQAALEENAATKE